MLSYKPVSALVLSFLHYCSAISFTSNHGDLNFTTLQIAPGSTVVAALYESCEMYTPSGGGLYMGNTCVAQLLTFMVEAVAAAGVGMSVVTTAEAGPFAVKESANDTTVRRRTDKHDGALLDAINGNLAKRSDPRRVLATEIVDSDIHPTNGIAARFNVHGPDRTLHVHTNGSHLLARFDSVGVSRRSFVQTDNQFFSFPNITGVKIQGHVLNGSISGDTDYGTNLQNSVSDFARTSPGLSFPAFAHSDAWTYQACTGQYLDLYGKIVVEAGGFASEYEALNPPECDGGLTDSSTASSTTTRSTTAKSTTAASTTTISNTTTRATSSED